MSRTNVTFDIVREIGLALPDVEDSTMYGSLALKVRGKLLACMAINKSAEPDSLGVRIDFEQRAGLLAEGRIITGISGRARAFSIQPSAKA